MSYWAVVLTHPQAERRALAHLERQGFVCYAPRTRNIKIRNGSRVQVEAWLFPRYLFIWIADRWHSVLSTLGVSTLLRNGDTPAKLPSIWIETMQAQEKDGFVILPKERFRKGERVQINSGVFAGLCGIYEGMSSRQRELVLLDVLGRVELAVGDLD